MFVCDVEDLAGEWLYVYLRVWWMGQWSMSKLSEWNRPSSVSNYSFSLHMHTLGFFSVSVSHSVLNQIPLKYFLHIIKNWADTDHWHSKQSSVDFQKRTNSQAHFHGQMTFCSICWGLTRMVSAGAGDDVDTDQLKGVRWLSGNLCCCLPQVKRVLCRSTPLSPIFSPSRHVPTKGASESTTLAL